MLLIFLQDFPFFMQFYFLSRAVFLVMRGQGIRAHISCSSPNKSAAISRLGLDFYWVSSRIEKYLLITSELKGSTAIENFPGRLRSKLLIWGILVFFEAEWGFCCENSIPLSISDTLTNQ